METKRLIILACLTGLLKSVEGGGHGGGHGGGGHGGGGHGGGGHGGGGHGGGGHGGGHDGVGHTPGHSPSNRGQGSGHSGQDGSQIHHAHNTHGKGGGFQYPGGPSSPSKNTNAADEIAFWEAASPDPGTSSDLNHPYWKSARAAMERYYKNSTASATIRINGTAVLVKGVFFNLLVLPFSVFDPLPPATSKFLRVVRERARDQIEEYAQKFRIMSNNLNHEVHADRELRNENMKQSGLWYHFVCKWLPRLEANISFLNQVVEWNHPEKYLQTIVQNSLKPTNDAVAACASQYVMRHVDNTSDGQFLKELRKNHINLARKLEDLNILYNASKGLKYHNSTHPMLEALVCNATRVFADAADLFGNFYSPLDRGIFNTKTSLLSSAIAMAFILEGEPTAINCYSAGPDPDSAPKPKEIPPNSEEYKDALSNARCLQHSTGRKVHRPIRTSDEGNINNGVVGLNV